MKLRISFTAPKRLVLKQIKKIIADLDRLQSPAGIAHYAALSPVDRLEFKERLLSRVDTIMADAAALPQTTELSTRLRALEKVREDLGALVVAARAK